MADPFSIFEVVPACPTDHRYYGYVPTNVASGVHKRIIQEWKLLESHLPDSIHVRAYEDRITHLTAAIGGVAGTPYHDGLFFFDVAFPADYPHSPPEVKYRSFGLQINPHICSTGYICLSLLNRRRVKDEVVWDPSQSTVLQVLLSIQALVLCERPYFTHPTMRRMKGRNKRKRFAEVYNENVFSLSCRTMIYVMSKPPEGFEALVVGHFLKRGRRVLLASRAYVTGRAQVGHHDDDQVNLSSCGQRGASKKLKNVSSRGRRGDNTEFRKDMVELYPQMVVSLESYGVAVDDLLELGVDAPVYKENTGTLKGNVVKRIKKAWSKFNHIVGLDPVFSYLC